MSKRLHGKVACVTGAASGLGREIARLFAAQGAKVAAMDVNADQLAETAADSENIRCVRVDVASAASVQSGFEEVRESLGHTNVLVCAAGVVGSKYGDGPAGDCTEEAWDHVMNVNLKGLWLCCKTGIAQMLAAGGGSIVNISSVTAMRPPAEFFRSHAYMTSKGGVISLSKAIASYYGRSKIRANVIAPGMIDTPMSKRMQGIPEIMAFLDKQTPLGALGEPLDIAQTALFLGSDESKYVTGQIISVDGGWTNHA